MYSDRADRNGKIITFYSYKGGTGRSMALANVAWILASNGYRVLVVDWDLEAPGLHSYFRPFLVDKALNETDGVIDMVTRYAVAAVTPEGDEGSDNDDDNAEWCEPYADVLNYVTPLDWKFSYGDGRGGVDLLPSGRQDDSYTTRFTTFDWQNFYGRLGGKMFLERVRASMRREYDYTLIDSRTGVGDASGICTVQMPDALVVCFTFNYQSINGASGVAEAALEQRLPSPGLDVFPLATRIEYGEKNTLEAMREYARGCFSQFPNRLRHGTPDDYWAEVQIPYVPFYAYHEVLAAFGDRSKDVRSMLKATERLAFHLTDGAVEGFIESEGDSVQSILDEYAGVRPARKQGESQGRVADNAYQQLIQQDKVLARRAILRLVKVGQPTDIPGDTLRRVRLSMFDERTQALLRRLRENQLVKLTFVAASSGGGFEFVELANDDILQGWATLRHWISERRAFLLWRQGLEDDVARWLSSNRNKNELLRGTKLEAAVRQLETLSDDLSSDERQYINESRAQVDARTPYHGGGGAIYAGSTPNAADAVKEATEILRGKSRTYAEILDLVTVLKAAQRFGLARRILSRARRTYPLNEEDRYLRFKLFQQSALCTYKDPDLPADSRLDRALEILREVQDLSQTRDQETLGLVGAIYKRKWEIDNQKSQLERSLFYYLRGYAEGAKNDQGYTGINAAYILDLLAHQEEEEAERARAPLGGPERKRIEERRAQAASIRSDIVEQVAPLVDAPDNDWLVGKWWFYSTVAEAFFGLGGRGNEEHYDVALAFLERGRKEATPHEWEFESTVRQLASLARLHAPAGATARDLEGTAAWRTLVNFLGRTAAVRSAFYGKIGLGLSGGGFRASLFHIGVLARLAEQDVLRHVEVLSCVSGGSVIGAHYYLEVRKLLQEKPDEEITREDYIQLVKRVERDFLRGVQRNVRTRVASEPWTNLKMIFGSDSAPLRWIFGPAYSRTMRAGELFESEIFSRVNDGESNGPRYISDLYILPKGEGPEFRPKYHNWYRESKVPILILNATTLNTGHSWHFTASYMGEPPAGIDSAIDSNDRFRRLYYEEAPERWQKVRLGHAVASSACVPGLFEPIALDGLYPERVVRLVDGGVCDNQGIAGLIEQDCNVILISDGSGQMESIKDPSRGLLGVPLRSSSILQARVRESQFEDLSARRRSQLLRGFMFVHLKQDLDVDPVDWIDCLDPSDADDDAARPASRKGRLTSYGIEKELQKSLASVRTDLDSFSDVEAYALMTSAYRMTEHALKDQKCVEGFDAPWREEEWDFLAVEGGMKGVGPQYSHVQKLLGVSGALAFKIWKLRRGLQYLACVLAVLVFAAGTWAGWMYRDSVLLKAVTLGAVGMFVVTLALTALGTALIGKRLMRVVRLRETLIRAGVWFFFGVLGSFVAWLHLHIFDPMFIREGSIDNYLRRFPQEEARARYAGATEYVASTRETALPPPDDATTAATVRPQSAPEIVGAAVEVVPMQTTTPPAEAVNGFAWEATETASAEIQGYDVEERQN